MDFTLTSKQEAIKKSIAEFCANEILPAAGDIEKNNRVPENLVSRMGELGIFGMPFDKQYGGTGEGYLTTALVMEELARASGAVAMVAGINYLAGVPISLFGTEEQKSTYLRRLCEGQAIGAFAFTEPATGSDPKAITTHANMEGGEWVLNGTKRFVTAGDRDGIIVMSAYDGKGISTFIGEKNVDGYTVTKTWDKLGMHGVALSDVDLNNYRLPAANMLGASGTGYRLLLDTIAVGKLNTCATILGCAQAALDEAIKYAKGRVVRGKPIADTQSIQTLIADMAVQVEAARWLTYRLAALADKNMDIKTDSALAKIFVTEAAVGVVNKAFRVHGAYAYVDDYRVGRLLRDVYLGEIVEGSNEIQKIIVASSLLKDS